MPSLETDRRLGTAARLIGLALVSASVAISRPGLGFSGRSLVVTITLAVAIVAWLAWTAESRRRSWSVVTLALLAGAGGILTGVAPAAAASACIFVAVVAAGARLEIGPAALVAGVGVASLAVTFAIEDRDGLGLLAFVAGIVAALLVGANARQRRARNEQTELLLAQTQRSTQEQLRSARLEESARIAREIHDVLAHALAGLTIQLDATAALIGQGAERDVVLERVDRARTLAREGLQETRLALGALRGQSIAVPSAVEELVGQYRASTDAPATLTIDGDLARLAGQSGLAVMRVVQEALTNARKHAPGAAVAVSIQAGARPGEPIVLVVRDAGAAPGAPSRLGSEERTTGGYGLRGMHERAEILGGTLSAGPDAGGWRVQLRLPGPPDGGSA